MTLGGMRVGFAPARCNSKIAQALERYRIMKEQSVVHSDPDILGGTPVFIGTRVPVQAFIDYIEGGHSLQEFLDDLPTVSPDVLIDAVATAAAPRFVGLATVR